MPLTNKGSRVLDKMKSFYGKIKGAKVFHASENEHKLKGVTKKAKK